MTHSLRAMTRDWIVVRVKGEVEAVVAVDPERPPVKLQDWLVPPGVGVDVSATAAQLSPEVRVLDITEHLGDDQLVRRTLWRLP